MQPVLNASTLAHLENHLMWLIALPQAEGGAEV
jgi:hypothetical protein